MWNFCLILLLTIPAAVSNTVALCQLIECPNIKAWWSATADFSAASNRVCLSCSLQRSSRVRPVSPTYTQSQSLCSIEYTTPFRLCVGSGSLILLQSCHFRGSALWATLIPNGRRARATGSLKPQTHGIINQEVERPFSSSFFPISSFILNSHVIFLPLCLTIDSRTLFCRRTQRARRNVTSCRYFGIFASARRSASRSTTQSGLLKGQASRLDSMDVSSYTSLQHHFDRSSRRADRRRTHLRESCHISSGLWLALLDGCCGTPLT